MFTLSYLCSSHEFPDLHGFRTFHDLSCNFSIMTPLGPSILEVCEGQVTVHCPLCAICTFFLVYMIFTGFVLYMSVLSCISASWSHTQNAPRIGSAALFGSCSVYVALVATTKVLLPTWRHL